MQEDNTPPEGAPEGSKQDKNGVWRNKNGQLLPGQVNNPKGRGLSTDQKTFKDKAQSYSMEVLEVMYGIMTNVKEKAADRIKAGDIILDRAYGKATTIVGTDDGDYTPRAIIVGIGNIAELEAEDDQITNSGEQLIIDEE
jgi:hypothetical protein